MIKIKKLAFLILLVGLGIFLIACSNGGGIVPTTNTIRGRVTVDEIPVENVEVSIVGHNRKVTTDHNGIYQFTDIPAGKYTLNFLKEGTIINNVSREVVVSGGKEIKQDLNLYSDDTTSVQDARNMINDINSHGIQMTETVTTNIPQVEASINREVSPYLQNLGMKLGYMAFILDSWLSDGPGMLAPGEYQGDWTGDIFVINQIVSNPIIPGENLKWDIVFNDFFGDGNNDKIEIELVNPEEVAVVDENWDIIEIDLTKAEFRYYQYMNDDPNLYSIDINCLLDTTSSRTILVEDINHLGESYEYPVYLPDLAEVNIDGLMIDNSGRNIGDENYEPVGEIEVTGILDIDIRDNQRIGFNGSLNSQVIDLEGELNLHFATFPNPDEIYMVPIPDQLLYNGSIDLGFMEIAGGLEIELIEIEVEEGIALLYPSLFMIEGSYEYFDDPSTDVNDYVKLDGLLSLTMDYSERVFTKPEQEGNYIGGEIAFNGGFERGKFPPLELKLTVSRDGFDQASSSFAYTYSDGKYIKGDIDYHGNMVNLEARNHRGLMITAASDLELDYSGSGQKIGTITNADRSEDFAEIWIKDLQPQVIFKDGSAQSFLY